MKIDYTDYWSTDKISLENIKKDVDKSRMACINKYANRKNRLLDIGCGQAHFAALIKEEGWDVRAIDPSAISKKACRKKKIKMIRFDQISKFNPFVITMWHLIEHFEDPLAYLRNLNKQVETGTWLFMETPNKDSHDARKNFKKWWYNQKEHLFYFNPRIMKSTLEKAGFDVISIKPIGGFGVNRVKKITPILDKYYRLFKPLKGIYYAISHSFNLSDCIRIVAKKRREI